MKKQFAMKALMVMAIAVALCMFFASTVQNITTPKVKLIKVQNGRLEQKTTLKAKVTFPSSEPFSFPEAIHNNVIVQKIHVKAGYPVKKGDVIFTAFMPDYDKNMKELRDKYEEKVASLSKKDQENRKLKKNSERNKRYNTMMAAQETLSDLRIQTRVLASQLGIVLPESVSNWAEAVENADPSLKELVESTVAAKSTYDKAVKSINETYKGKSKTSDELYNYVLSRNKLIAEMDDLEAQMTALELAKLNLETVSAPRDGYISTMDIKEGDTYDGKKAAFSMDDKGAAPVLRADASLLKKTVERGSNATVKGEYGDNQTTVLGTGIGTDGKRFVDLALTPELLEDRGGLAVMINQGELDVQLSYRAAQATTLLPASAVREDDSGHFVYLIQQTSGGLTGQSMKLRKQSVTVLDKSDKMISLSDDLSRETIADKEDRAIEDGMRVMEYVR
ncbi:HlyD family secretion protein [Eubacteriales bacterium OttesenSCG-928-N13]|nr:HlyD family secretion protein [Eubacteriales bacterium OttesenSCG-928-N13]